MDLAIAWDAANFRGDWTVTSGDLGIDPGGLRSAVLISLFTDRAAPLDWQPPAGTPWERRGVWVDSYEAEPAGSWLWLLNQAVKTPALLNQVNDYASGALLWLKTRGIVSSVTVTSSWMQPTVIGMRVVLTRLSSPPFDETFGWAWQGAA